MGTSEYPYSNLTQCIMDLYHSPDIEYEYSIILDGTEHMTNTPWLIKNTITLTTKSDDDNDNVFSIVYTTGNIYTYTYIYLCL